MESLEDFREERVREYFRDRLPGVKTDGKVRDLLFLLLDEKPGALVMGVDRDTRKVLEDFSREFGLEMKVVEGGDRSLINRLLGRDKRFMKDSVFLARNRKRFRILEESDGRFCGFSDRAVGEFLGYPDSAIEYYVEKTEEEPAGMEVAEKVEEMIEEEELDEDAEECLEMLSYLPRPEEENIREAVEKGRGREKLWDRFSAILESDSDS
ncbi:MAG: hypothetical protein ABEK16_04715 [Candidatus Nanohalobium sp.]